MPLSDFAVPFLDNCPFLLCKPILPLPFVEDLALYCFVTPFVALAEIDVDDFLVAPFSFPFPGLGGENAGRGFDLGREWDRFVGAIVVMVGGEVRGGGGVKEMGSLVKQLLVQFQEI